MEKLRKRQGITLIALVVTIIVLLILAGVTLRLVAGSDGILNRATKAVDQNEIAGAREQVDLKLAEWSEKFYEEKYVTRNLDTEATKQNYIKDSIGEKVTIGKYTLKNVGDYKVSLVETKRGTILGEGEINAQGGIDWSDEVTGEIEKPTPETPVTPVAKYTVSYDGNGGTGVPEDSGEYESGATVRVKFEGAPTREGYQFLGWATNAGATSAEYTSGGTETFTMREENVALYAVWKEKVEISKSNVGQYVDLGTNLLDRTIALSGSGEKPRTDWRIFYTEGENVWLIMSDYLPYEKNSIVGSPLTQFTNPNSPMTWPFNWKSDIDRDDLITQLLDESKWKKLLPVELQDLEMVHAYGAVDVETWAKAWNYYDGGKQEVGTKFVTSGYNAPGWLVSVTQYGSSYFDYDISGLTAYSLFFPHDDGYSTCSGYWLASQSAYKANYVLKITDVSTLKGSLGIVAYNNSISGIRPAICIPQRFLVWKENVWELVEVET